MIKNMVKRFIYVLLMVCTFCCCKDDESTTFNVEISDSFLLPRYQVVLLCTTSYLKTGMLWVLRFAIGTPKEKMC